MNINNQNILNGFLNTILDIDENEGKRIKYNPQFMDHKLRVEKGEIDFMNVITHPNIRIVLRVNEFALTRAEHPNPRFAKASNVILLRGTQYGTIALFGKEAEYKRDAKTKDVHGPLPRLHATRAFLMAADRFFRRKGIPFSLQTGEVMLVNWIFSESFTDDLLEQAKLDTANKIELGDGMPPKPPYKKKPVNPDAKAADHNRAPSNDAKFERRSKPRTKADPKAA